MTPPSPTADSARTALVTGASRGIGAAIARRLAADGFAVGVNYLRSRDRAEVLVGEIVDAGGRAVAIGGDVSAPEDVAAMWQTFDRELGPELDVVVNNAGIFERHDIADAGLDAFDHMMRLNVRGVYDVTRHAVGRLREGGRVIVIGSCMADRGMMTGSALYNMSKAAVAGLVRGWARDLGPRGITANCVQPGPIDTEMNPDTEESPGAAALRAMTALDRFGTPDEIAALVSFLARPESAFLTGATLTADGGLNA